jgi:hypothetical protein
MESHDRSRDRVKRIRFPAWLLVAATAGAASPGTYAQLSCTIQIQARWTLPEGQLGYIGLKSAVDDKDSFFRVENGNWQLLDDHSFGRVVVFHPDGRWEDQYRQCQYCRERAISGRVLWRMREEIQPGCDYRRQFAFYLFVRDAQTTKLISEKRIYVPGTQSYTRRGLRLIDLGDLGAFF